MKKLSGREFTFTFMRTLCARKRQMALNQSFVLVADFPWNEGGSGKKEEKSGGRKTTAITFEN